jgi:dynein heavy chain 1
VALQQLWLVIFCDEINLPSPDKYGTQRVISFMRQLVEQVGWLLTPPVSAFARS